jgi:uncharacterized caspase-like protein
MAKKKSPPKPNNKRQRALVIGVSDYPAPIPKLPAVAADVREMANVLASRNGAFTPSGVTVLTNGQATRPAIVKSLRTVFSADADETVFVYIAGHGSVEGTDYFFVAHDTDCGDLLATGVPLSEIKCLFDRSKSRRVFLWLDFCHSGGILARGHDADDLAVIRRALQVVKGEGRVIVAACTPSQSAYEDPAVGHGLFTDALLRGLRGEAKSAQGEVTAMSLYEFIDHQVASGRQQPMFFGKMTGRVILMHYPDRNGTPSTSKKKTKSVKPKGECRPTKSGIWIMLGDHFFLAESVRHRSDGSLEVIVPTTGGEDEAALASLRPSRFGGHGGLPFAVNNDAHFVRVAKVETETASGSQRWHLTLAVEEVRSGASWMEMTYNTGERTYTPDDIAKMRAGRILINDPPRPAGRNRGFASGSMLEGAIEGSNSSFTVKECVIRSVYQSHRDNPNWKEFARLQAVFVLKASGTVEHVLELKLGTVRSNGIAVEFRGRRRQAYGNVPASTITVSGACPLA